MKTAYVLALDIGTSSVRAALYDSAGNVLPAKRWSKTSGN
jgi:sugar (pentulose or hexulose) kinase